MYQVLLIISAIAPVSTIVPTYSINHLLEFAAPFSLLLLLGRFSYQLPISGPPFTVVIVSATPLSYSYQHTISAIK